MVHGLRNDLEAASAGSALRGSAGGGGVDWLHLSFYGPTFNLADVWLRAGLLIAVTGWLWQRWRAG